MLFPVFAALTLPSTAHSAEPIRTKPRLLVVPWVVIDRNTNRDCAKLDPPQPTASAEARDLAMAAQATLDARMHRHPMVAMVPRREWEPHWKQLAPGQGVSQGPGCAVCTPVGNLLHYDRAALQQLGQSVQADYVWLGVTVVPLIAGRSGTRPDDCCREALGRERDSVLARSSALLVRVRDGAVVWQRDARRFDADVPRHVGRAPLAARLRREFAVKGTAEMLGNAFRREHRAWQG
jgi:hypothetical protein